MIQGTVGRNTSELGVGTGAKRRIGRETSVLDQSGLLIAEATGLEWTTTIEQVPVPIVGSYQDEVKPGGETRTFTLTVQNVDDFWQRFVWHFIRARRNPQEVAEFPEFTLVTKIATPGVPTTRWQLTGCKLYSLGQSQQQSEGVLQSQIAGTYNDEEPLESFEYLAGNKTHTFGPGETSF